MVTSNSRSNHATPSHTQKMQTEIKKKRQGSAIGLINFLPKQLSWSPGKKERYLYG